PYPIDLPRRLRPDSGRRGKNECGQHEAEFRDLRYHCPTPRGHHERWRAHSLPRNEADPSAAGGEHRKHPVHWSVMLDCARPFNYLICPQQQRWRDRQIERLGRLQVDDQLERRWLLDGEIRRLRALKKLATCRPARVNRTLMFGPYEIKP